MPKGMCLIQTDIIRFATRNAITGENPDKNISRVSFKVTATYPAKDDPTKLDTLSFERNNQGEDDLAWLGILGMLYYFDGDTSYQTDLVIEGVAVKPAKVNELEVRLKKFEVKAVFVGHSKGPELALDSAKLKTEAEKSGYPYLDRVNYEGDEQAEAEAIAAALSFQYAKSRQRQR